MAEDSLAHGEEPFSDRDAAERKRRALARELGQPLEMVGHPEGGYGLRPAKPEAVPPEEALRVQREASAEREYAAQWRMRPAPRAFLANHLSAAGAFLVMVQPHLVFTLSGLGMPRSPTMTALAMTVLSLSGLVLGVLSLGRFVWCYASYRYLITPDAVESVYGIVARASQRVQLSHVRTIDVTQTVLERVLGVGTVRLATGGTDTYEATLRYVASPMKLRRELLRRVAGSRTSAGRRGVS